MPRFAANLTLLFTEVPVLDRFAAAKAAGFDAVEILFPYDDSPTAILNRLQDNSLDLALINTPPGNSADGERGCAAVPGAEDQFRRDFDRALDYANLLKPRHIHVMAGKAEGPRARATFLRNLQWAAAQAPDHSLTIEPINPIDMPGYFLNDFDEAASIIAEVGAPNPGLQFDCYHAQIITGDVMQSWHAYRAITRHIQVAGYPGRHEPVAGDIDYPTLFARLDSDGYEGFVSGEYHPNGRTVDGLGWTARS